VGWPERQDAAVLRSGLKPEKYGTYDAKLLAGDSPWFSFLRKSQNL
jgi:hypothetical protein